jgi:iron(III) transport system ATP-binding protein
MLSVRGVTKSFAVRRGVVQALAGVDLQAETGQLTAILGASGSGKTTLLRVIAGFERPDAGQVRLDDRLLAGDGVFVRPEQRGIGIVPQDGALFPHLDVAGNIGYGLRSGLLVGSSGTNRKERSERVAALLELIGMPGYQRRRVDELSGGQQQRVALARALAPEPAVVLLDEPFSAIDASLRAELGVEVRELLDRLGVTAVLVTHDQEEALSLAARVAVMRDGRVVQIGTPSEIYQHPVDADTARFVGEAVVLPGRVLESVDGACRVECALGCVLGVGAVGLVPGKPCEVVIRPHHLVLDTDGVPARVVATRYFGHEVVTRLRLGADGGGPDVRVRSAGTAPRPDDLAHVRVEGPVVILNLG